MEEDAKLDLIDSSNLTYLIPQATNFRLEDELKHVKQSHEDVFKSIERRESLFFETQMNPSTSTSFYEHLMSRMTLSGLLWRE